MMYLANILVLSNFSLTAVIIIAVAGFLIGFLVKFNESRKSSKKLSDLRKVKSSNKERINALKKRIDELERDNDANKSSGEKN